MKHKIINIEKEVLLQHFARAVNIVREVLHVVFNV